MGLASSSTISNSYATGPVTDSGIGLGGLVGYSNRSTIDNSYATGEVRSSGGWVGGLVGFAYEGTISNSYATGSVTGSGSSVGGLVGIVGSGDGIPNINSSYWDTKTTRRSTSAGGEGKSTHEMKLKGTYLNWDFDTVWKIDEGNGYPKLK